MSSFKLQLVLYQTKLRLRIKWGPHQCDFINIAAVFCDIALSISESPVHDGDIAMLDNLTSLVINYTLTVIYEKVTYIYLCILLFKQSIDQ